MSTFVGIPRIPTAAPSEEMDPRDARAVRMAVSVLLDYPGDDFEAKLNAVEEALVATLPEPDEETIRGFRRLISQGPPTELVGVGDLAATPFPTSDTTMGR